MIEPEMAYYDLEMNMDLAVRDDGLYSRPCVIAP